MLKTFGLVAISLLSLAGVLYFVDVREVGEALGHVGVGHIALSLGLLIAGNALAYWRFYNVLSAFNVKPGRRDLLAAFSLGQVSNQFLLNILGQSVTRAMMLTRAGVPVSVSVAATYVERLLAAGLLFLLSLFSLWYLLHRITFDPARIANLAFFSVALIAVLCVSVAIFFRERVGAMAITTGSWLIRLWPSSLLTLLIHLTTLLAYLVLLDAIQPSAATWDAVAALTIVMFTAALPISFSGWGVRELSAATAFGIIGLSPQVAVSTALVIGVLSFAIMFAFLGISLILRRARTAAMQTQIAAAEPARFNIDRIAIDVCAVLCALLIGFQLRVPVTNGELSVNIADPIAVTGGLLCLYHLVVKRAAFPLYKWASAALIAIGGLLLAGIASAYLQDVLGRWAIVNRGAGWLIILCYVLVAATSVALGGERRRLMLMRLFVSGILTIGVLHLLLILFSYFVQRVPNEIMPLPLQGFVNNSNAFAFILTLAAVALMALAAARPATAKDRLLPLLFTLLMLAMYYCKSRTGLLLFGLMICAMLAISAGALKFPDNLRRQFRFSAFAMAGAFVFATFLPVAIVEFIDHFLPAYMANADALLGTNSLGIKLVHSTSDSERAELIEQAFALWRAHPIFGAGLGAFTEWRVASGMTLQVIHSVPVWLLTEMGPGGLALIGGVSLYLLLRGWRLLQEPETRTVGLGLLTIMVMMGVGCLLQDYFYQRGFWLLFGLFCAIPLADAARAGQKA